MINKSIRRNSMKISKIIVPIIAASIATPLLASALVVAGQTSAYVDAGVSADGTPLVGTHAQVNITAKISDAKSRADKEINRRVDALTMLNTRVQAMVHVSAQEKSSLAAAVSAQISSLTSLKTTIDAETSTTTLKTEIKSITQSYRIFMLVIPQAHIAVAADKVETVGDLMTALSGKLQTRITAAQNAGKDVSAMNTSMTDLSAKIADANAQASAAVAETVNLKPDNGEPTLEAANKAALEDARAKIKVALQDLKTARKDAGAIVKALVALHLTATATSSATVH
jgi:uncharacterized protein YicC (UPF0701 family)